MQLFWTLLEPSAASLKPWSSVRREGGVLIAGHGLALLLYSFVFKGKERLRLIHLTRTPPVCILGEQTQHTLKRLYSLAGLGRSWWPPEEVEEVVWEVEVCSGVIIIIIIKECLSLSA